eukprot:Sspe_Gene.105921::Locus_83030_Transcript_1_1_Confidence_1.000_Length_796::g.105921::m.105921
MSDTSDGRAPQEAVLVRVFSTRLVSLQKNEAMFRTTILANENHAYKILLADSHDLLKASQSLSSGNLRKYIKLNSTRMHLIRQLQLLNLQDQQVAQRDQIVATEAAEWRDLASDVMWTLHDAILLGEERQRTAIEDEEQCMLDRLLEQELRFISIFSEWNAEEMAGRRKVEAEEAAQRQTLHATIRKIRLAPELLLVAEALSVRFQGGLLSKFMKLWQETVVMRKMWRQGVIDGVRRAAPKLEKK